MKKLSRENLKLMLGTSKSVSVLTILNLVLYGGWLILYFVCTIIRETVFNSTQARMASQGQMQYTITFSSPIISFLKIMIYLLPVLAIVWAIFISRKDKKNIICDKKLIIVALCVVVAAAFVAFIDIGSVGLIF